MLSFVKSLSLLFFFMGCCVGADEAEVSASGSEQKAKRLCSSPTLPNHFRIDLAALNTSPSPNRFKIDLPLDTQTFPSPYTISPKSFRPWTLCSPSEKVSPYEKFCRERDNLLQKISMTSDEDRYKHVVTFDFDGVLTMNSRPEKEIKFGREGCDFYQKLIARGATVLITSSRFEQQEIVDALKTKGIQFPSLQTEIIDDLEFTWADNVISACTPNDKTFQERPAKFEAALLYCQKKRIIPLSITLIDDQERNIERFTSGDAGTLLGVNHPKAEGMYFPTAALNNE